MLPHGDSKIAAITSHFVWSYIIVGNGYATPVLGAHFREFCCHQRPKILERHIALHWNQCIYTSSNDQPFLSVYLLTYSEQRLIADSNSLFLQYPHLQNDCYTQSGMYCGHGLHWMDLFVNKHPPSPLNWNTYFFKGGGFDGIDFCKLE